MQTAGCYEIKHVTDITGQRQRQAVCHFLTILTGMKIDINRRILQLPIKQADFSGPAIRPVAVRMVHQVAQAVKRG